MLIFHYNALPVNNAFAAGLIDPPAAVASLNPGRKPVVVEAVRTRDDEPSDEDRLEWYFQTEINKELDLIAAEREAMWAMERWGYNHS